jgi:hypothetical protein
MTRAGKTLFFKIIVMLFLSMVVLVIFVRGYTESIYGGCWAIAKNDFMGLKDGENKINLGDCIDRVYLATKDGLQVIKGEVNIFSCAKRDDPDYNSFAILKPVKDVKVEYVFEEGGRKVRRLLLETFCVNYKYMFNSVNKKSLDGSKRYCINMEGAGSEPDVNKNLFVTEGECG